MNFLLENQNSIQKIHTIITVADPEGSLGLELPSAPTPFVVKMLKLA